MKLSKKQNQDEIIQLEKKNELIDLRIKEIEETTTKCKIVSAVLMKSIDDHPVQELLEPKKIGILKTRVEQTLKLVERTPVTGSSQLPVSVPSRPALKPQYGFKARFGRRGIAAGQFTNPSGIAIELSTGHLFISDTNNSRIQV